MIYQHPRIRLMDEYSRWSMQQRLWIRAGKRWRERGKLCMSLSFHTLNLSMHGLAWLDLLERTCIGIKCCDGVVLAVEKLVHSKLLVPAANKRIGHVDLHAGIVKTLGEGERESGGA